MSTTTIVKCDRCNAPLSEKRDLISGVLSLSSLNGAFTLDLSVVPPSQACSRSPDLCRECLLYLFGLVPEAEENPLASIPLALPEGIALETVLQAAALEDLSIHNLQASSNNAVEQFRNFVKTYPNGEYLAELSHNKDSWVVAKWPSTITEKQRSVTVCTIHNKTEISWLVDAIRRYLFALQKTKGTKH